MAKNKFAVLNRENKNRITAKLSEVRGACPEMAAKRRLRSAEESLTVAPPVTETDVSYIDGDILFLLDGFLKVQSEGVLTERYLDRIDDLLARRATLK